MFTPVCLRIMVPRGTDGFEGSIIYCAVPCSGVEVCPAALWRKLAKILR